MPAGGAARLRTGGADPADALPPGSVCTDGANGSSGRDEPWPRSLAEDIARQFIRAYVTDPAAQRRMWRAFKTALDTAPGCVPDDAAFDDDTADPGMAAAGAAVNALAAMVPRRDDHLRGALYATAAEACQRYALTSDTGGTRTCANLACRKRFTPRAHNQEHCMRACKSKAYRTRVKAREIGSPGAVT